MRETSEKEVAVKTARWEGEVRGDLADEYWEKQQASE